MGVFRGMLRKLCDKTENGRKVPPNSKSDRDQIEKLRNFCDQLSYDDTMIGKAGGESTQIIVCAFFLLCCIGYAYRESLWQWINGRCVRQCACVRVDVDADVDVSVD